MPPQPEVTGLSIKRRTLYFRILFAIFVLALPVVYLYATGYTFGGGEIVPTGGIYVDAERADAEIYINNELVRETGTFRRAFYIQSLEPGMYNIRVEKEGHHPWIKTLPVLPRIVTEAQAFNMPLEPTIRLIPQWLQLTSATSTASERIENPAYAAVLELFEDVERVRISPGSITARTLEETERLLLEELATTTRELQDIVLFEEGAGTVMARWVGTKESTPFFFCLPDSECEERISLNTRGEIPGYFDFYPAHPHLAIIELDDGVYVTELDNRSGQNLQPLFLGDAAEVRVEDGSVFVKEGDRVFEIEL